MLPCCLRQISEAASRLSIAPETTLVRPSAALALFVCAVLRHVKFPVLLFSLSMVGTLGCRCATVSHPNPSHLQGWTCCAFSLGTRDCFSHWLLPLTSCNEASPPKGLLLLLTGWPMFLAASFMKSHTSLCLKSRPSTKTQGSFLPRSDAPVEIVLSVDMQLRKCTYTMYVWLHVCFFTVTVLQ